MWLDDYYRNLYLCHHGIKGQKWGVRRTPEQLGHVKKKSLEKSEKESIIKTERGLSVQKTSSLKKGISTLRKRIAEHEDKIRDPENYYEGWFDLSPEEQQGAINHWRKEIDTFQKSIDARNDEIERRNDEE